MSESQGCSCTGIRFCALCRESSRVRKLFNQQINLRDAATVISKQNTSERTSSYSLAITKKSEYALCIECSKFYCYNKPLLCCTEHATCECAENIFIDGAYVIPNFINDAEEEMLLEYFDKEVNGSTLWQNSQSGRRKQEYGPTKNFKKKKVKVNSFISMPCVFRDLFKRISIKVEELTHKPYTIAEASVLEYVENKLSNIDLHVDDTWLWGNRIAGINLLSHCSMTFMNAEETCIEVCLPRHCFFLMSGDCRYNWMHGIRPENVRGRRISITLRELSDEIFHDEALRAAILSSAQKFE